VSMNPVIGPISLDIFI